MHHHSVSQAWYRKIQTLNLTKEYKDSSSSIGSWLKLFFGLPALPPSAVGDCFADILFPSIPDDPRASLFSDYIEFTYIEEFSEFPPAIWASDNLKGRTTNACESFHFHFSKYFNCPHPNIFVFIEAVDEEMKKSTLKII
ncbi:phosphoglucomutase-3 [Elysia marginata]|uniref:Phosphoglucomutase-3 n=1 Tax=Elysia marginata TaxID=1093978 RepID=A0AAV4H0Z3_9GAST|nr:phosphoglucomutase-3 [Elysia marginata]